MNLFELFVKIGVDDQASAKLNGITSKLGKGLATAAKIGTAAVGAAATGIAALTGAAVKNYAEYEQLVGGVETLFKESSDKVKQYANEAYKSAGLSANEYMSTVTSFSASLLQSLGRGAQQDLGALEENLDAQYKAAKQNYEDQYDAAKKSWDDKIALAKKMKKANVDILISQRDEELKALKRSNESGLASMKKANAQRLKDAETANNKSVQTAETQALAADLANQAVIDMSDNAAKMGTSMEMIQNAYQGFAKQNYTMLDNLKLGYGGTQEEMKRLVKDAAALDKSIDANSLSFANIVKAINVVQTEMGITGTTAKEAGRTIEGSVNAMKAAWTNLVTGIADKNADLKTLVNDFVTTIVGDGTENNLGVFGNIKPAIETALEGATTLIQELFPQIVEMLPSLLEKTIPNLVSSALSVVESIIDAISNNSGTLSESIVGAITSILLHAAENAPKFIGGIITLILSLIKEIGKNLGTIIPALITGIADIISEIAVRVPELTDAIFAVIDGIVNALTSPEGIVKMTTAGFELLLGLIPGIVGSIPKVISGILSVITNIATTFKETDWGELGKNIVDGVLGGLKNAWANLTKWFSDAWNNLVGGVKDLLGIHSPSRVFAGIGRNMALGIGEGWDDEFGDIEKSINGSLSFDDATFGVSSYSGGSMLGGIGGTSFGTVNINIEGYNAQDDDELAEIIIRKMQFLTEREAAVYA